VDNDNGIANKVYFSRWADGGGVYGYYDWLYQNELAIKAVPGLRVKPATGLLHWVPLERAVGWVV
jgi:hypothetical protein